MLGIAQMQKLRWVSEHTSRDRIRNEDIGKGLGVANNEGNINKETLTWFGHVQRRGIGQPVINIESWSQKT